MNQWIVLGGGLRSHVCYCCETKHSNTPPLGRRSLFSRTLTLSPPLSPLACNRAPALSLSLSLSLSRALSHALFLWVVGVDVACPSPLPYSNVHRNPCPHSNPGHAVSVGHAVPPAHPPSHRAKGFRSLVRNQFGLIKAHVSSVRTRQQRKHMAAAYAHGSSVSTRQQRRRDTQSPKGCRRESRGLMQWRTQHGTPPPSLPSKTCSEVECCAFALAW